VHDPLVVLDHTLHVVSVNRSYCREFGGDTKNSAGKAFFDIGEGRWNFAAMRDLLENVLAHERQFERRTLEHDSPTLGRQRVQVSGRRIDESAGADAFVLLVIEPCANGTA
jgi:two-component system, chemotaxis family, CheB/CheR fusion protein